MSVVNLGNQTLTFDYMQPGKAEEFNQLLRGTIKPGIYSGAECTYDSNIITIPAFRAFLNVGTDLGVLAVTTTDVEVTAIAPKDYLVMSLTWANT